MNTALEEIVTNKRFLSVLGKLAEFHHTGELEQYHSCLLKYASKRQHLANWQRKNWVAKPSKETYEYIKSMNAGIGKDVRRAHIVYNM